MVQGWCTTPVFAVDYHPHTHTARVHTHTRADRGMQRLQKAHLSLAKAAQQLLAIRLIV